MRKRVKTEKRKNIFEKTKSVEWYRNRVTERVQPCFQVS